MSPCPTFSPHLRAIARILLILLPVVGVEEAGHSGRQPRDALELVAASAPQSQARACPCRFVEGRKSIRPSFARDAVSAVQGLEWQSGRESHLSFLVLRWSVGVGDGAPSGRRSRAKGRLLHTHGSRCDVASDCMLCARAPSLAPSWGFQALRSRRHRIPIPHAFVRRGIVSEPSGCAHSFAQIRTRRFPSQK